MRCNGCTSHTCCSLTMGHVDSRRPLPRRPDIPRLPVPFLHAPTTTTILLLINLQLLEVDVLLSFLLYGSTSISVRFISLSCVRFSADSICIHSYMPDNYSILRLTSAWRDPMKCIAIRAWFGTGILIISLTSTNICLYRY